jgi:hypothetical protein
VKELFRNLSQRLSSINTHLAVITLQFIIKQKSNLSRVIKQEISNTVTTVLQKKQLIVEILTIEILRRHSNMLRLMQMKIIRIICF